MEIIEEVKDYGKLQTYDLWLNLGDKDKHFVYFWHWVLFKEKGKIDETAGLEYQKGNKTIYREVFF